MEKNYVYEIYGDEIPGAKVWEKLREGDVRALKTLFLRHHKPLHNYGAKLSGDRFLAEDCVHDLYFRIWDRRQHLGQVRSVKSYLWISLRRDLIKAMNSNRRKVRTDDIVTYLCHSGQSLSNKSVVRFHPEEFRIHEERKSECKAALAKALNQLPPRQREAVFLKFFNGMGYNEIEQIMSINYQSARNYVSGGVQALKSYFKEHPDKPVPYFIALLLF